jgi:1-piperideine-2-carboxylate/1-pyrroline-2-carboxylate reductase [NAD(P)H]
MRMLRGTSALDTAARRRCRITAMMRLDARATAQALPERELADALLVMFDRAARGEVQAAARVHVDLPGEPSSADPSNPGDPPANPSNSGVLLLMPACGPDFTVLKTVTVHAANAREGRLPVVQADVVLMNTRTGERLLQIDGATLTARRTAALSAAGLERLGRTQATRMLLVGAGVQAAAQARCFLKLWPLARLTIHARNPAKARALAQALEREHLRSGVRIDATGGSAGELQVEARHADLIVTATSATTPVLDAPVNPRASIVALGAYRASMAELSPSLVKACRTIVVDSMINASREAGDLLQAGIDWSGVTELAQAAPLAEGGEGPVLLKTVGHALWDLAAAEVAWGQVN